MQSPQVLVYFFLLGKMVQSEDFFFGSKEGEVVNHFMKVKKVATLVLLK
jgi:hypothetical protein